MHRTMSVYIIRRYSNYIFSKSIQLKEIYVLNRMLVGCWDFDVSGSGKDGVKFWCNPPAQKRTPTLWKLFSHGLSWSV